MMDRLADSWKRCGEILGERPIQFLFYLVGAVLVSIALSYSLFTSAKNDKDLKNIKTALCNDPSNQTHAQKIAQCQELFDNLLANPTPAQVQRLRELVKGK